MSATVELLHEARAMVEQRRFRLRAEMKAAERELAVIDQALAAIAASAAPARDVAPGEPWPFTDHRSMAEVLASHNCNGAA